MNVLSVQKSLIQFAEVMDTLIQMSASSGKLNAQISESLGKLKTPISGSSCKFDTQISERSGKLWTHELKFR